MSAYARHALLPPAWSKKKSKSSTTGTALRAPFRSLPPVGQIQKTQTNMPKRDSFSQPSSDGSLMQSQQKVLAFDGHGTRQYQRYGSSAARIHSNAPSREIVHSEEPMSQLTEFSQFSSAQSISHDSIVNHPELNQRSVTSSSNHKSTPTSSNRFSYVRRGFVNADKSLISKTTAVPSSQTSAGQSFNASLLSNGSNLQAQAMQSRKATRPWMNGWSSKASFMSKTTPLKENGFASERNTLPKKSQVGNGCGGLCVSSRWTADSSIKLEQDDTSIALDGEISKAKTTSLITHHFKPVVQDNLESSPRSDAKTLQDVGMAALNEKQRDLEKLAFDLETKMKTFDETGMEELAKKQRELEKLAIEIDTKMRTFDEMSKEELARSTEMRKRLEEESNDAIQRVNEASIEALETIKRASQSGVDALTNMVAEARDAAAQAKRRIIQEIKHAAKGLLPFLFDKKAVVCASDPEYGATLSSQEADDSGSKSSSTSSRPTEISVPPLVQMHYLAARTVGRDDSVMNRTPSKAAASSRKRAGTVEIQARQSKRLKSKATAQSPKVKTPVRNIKAFCVTPSARSASRVAPPVSEKSQTKTVAKKTNSAKHVALRGKKKHRMSSEDEKLQLSWTVSESDSSSTSLCQASSGIVVSPPKKKVPRHMVGRTTRRRTYGKQRRTVETSLVDDFSFMSSD
jgi:hypothetical protein